jgi:large subunit ribosomal protein L9
MRYSPEMIEVGGRRRRPVRSSEFLARERIMKVLLQRNVDKLGKIGDIVNVSPGYGRNFLLPQGLAVDVTKNNLNRFESMKRRLIAEERETKAKFQVLAKELAKASCTIIANASEEGRLYGSVTAREIAKQYAADDLEVDPKAILLEEPIKELGIYKVTIQLHPEVSCEAKVWVVKGDGQSTPRVRSEDDESADDGESGESDD